MADRSWGKSLFDLFKTDAPTVVPTAHRYLELARECLNHAECITSRRVSTSLKFNHGQCEYLVGKLDVAVQTADVWAQLNSSEFNSECHEIMKIMWRSAKEIESFVQGCCKEEWIEAAMVLANMSAYVSSLGYNLESCIFLLGNDTNTMGAAPISTGAQDWIVQQLDVLRVRESDAVNGRVSRDQGNLLSWLESLIHSSNVRVQGSAELAECLAGRLSQHLSGSVQLSVWKIHHSSLRQVHRLGSGAVGMVYRSICWTGRIEVAEKVFYGSDHPSFVNEVEILAGLAHPNITPLLGYATGDSRSSIVMELMDGDLLFLMEARLRENSTWKFPFTTSEAVDIMLQTAEGMLYLHEKRVVHGDLKSPNILVKSRKDIDVEYVFIKVADFGLSKTKESSSTYSTQTPNIGTTRWMAPELMTLGRDEVGAKTSDHERELRHPFKADVYSFGMVCYEILTGKVPFYTISSVTEVKRMVLNGDRPILPDYCPNELQILIHSCWEEEATGRPSFVEICKTLRRLKWLPVVGVKSRSSAVTAPITNRVCPPPLAQIDEAYRAPCFPRSLEVKRYKGIRYRPGRMSWVAEMRPPGKRNKVFFGDFKSQIDAARAVDAAFYYFSRNHPLNFSDSANILSNTLYMTPQALDEDEKLRFVKDKAKWLASIRV